MAPASPRRREAVLVATLAIAVGLGVVGAAGGLLPEGTLRTAGLWMALASLALLALAAGLGERVQVLRALGSREAGGTHYERLRRWGRLRASGLALHLVVIAGALVLAFASGVRAGVLGSGVPSPVLDRGALVLAGALAALFGLAFMHSLRTPLEQERGGVRTVLALLGLSLQGVLVLVTFLALTRKGTLADVGLGGRATELLLLAGFVGAGANLAFLRLPRMATLLSLERGAGPVPLPSSRARHVVAPVLFAFALLLVVFLLFVLFGVGVFGLLDEVTRSPTLLTSLLLLAGALAVSVAAAVNLSRADPTETALYRRAKDPTEVLHQRIFLVSILGGSLLFAASIIALRRPDALGLPARAWMHLLTAALLVAVGPYGFLRGWEHRRIRRMEERFPDFLRDVASSHKGGLTLTAAIQVAARGEYGPLTAEIRKMADQLTWNVPFTEALERFADRVRTPLVRRAVSLILQANRSGGSTTDVLLAAARDAREIKALENERRLSMSLYTIVVYVTFFVFLAVVAVLYQRFVPQLVLAGESVEGSSLSGTGFAPGGPSLAEFQFLYFTAALVQAMGDGVVAGLMGQGRASLGLRHSFLMVLCTYVAFVLVV